MLINTLQKIPLFVLHIVTVNEAVRGRFIATTGATFVPHSVDVTGTDYFLCQNCDNLFKFSRPLLAKV